MQTTVLRRSLAALGAAGIAALVPAVSTPAQAAQPAQRPLMARPAAVPEMVVVPGVGAVPGLGAVPGRGAAELPELAPSPAAGTIARAGTSFLGAAAIAPEQGVSVGAATGDYLYWSFTASAGEIYDVTATVTLPAAQGRHGAQKWIIEAFDGLRRRQACVAGTQSAVAEPADSQVSVRCTLRQVRSWAEPWSGDPLPGTFYLRLSVNKLPEQDLGQPAQVDLSLGMRTGSVTADDGELAAPLAPVSKPGAVVPADSAGATPDPAAAPAEDDDLFDMPDMSLPSLSARWFWTAGGGVLAAVLGVVGFALTRRNRAVQAG